MTAAQAIRLAPAAEGAALAEFRPRSYDAAARTVELIAATPAPYVRGDWVEVLDLSGIDASRPSIPLLDAHRANTLEAVIGRVVRTKVVAGELVALVAFADTPAGRAAAGMVARGEVAGVSIGYRIGTWRDGGTDGEGRPIFVAERLELLEVSLVPVPADPNARIRSHIPEKGRLTMETESLPDDRANLAHESNRRSAIADLATRAGLPDHEVDVAMTTGLSLDAFRVRAFDHLAARAAAQGATTSVSVVRDEGDTMRRGMIDAIAQRVGAAPTPGPADRFRGNSIVEMAALHIGSRGRVSSAADKIDVLERAFHTTSDFPILFAAGTERALARAYETAAPVHRRIAAERSVRDFRPVKVVRPGSFPTLQSVGQAGEIQFGSFGEEGETIAVAPYATRFNISRQMLVNDDLGAIEQLLAANGQMVSLFEDQMFFAVTLLAGSGAGPTMADGVATFHANRGNLAGTATAISTTALDLARRALRKQKGVPTAAGLADGLALNIEPALLLMSPDKETEADSVLATLSPTTVAGVNPFSGTLQKVVSAQLSGNGWYVLANPARTPGLVSVKLDGFAAPRLRVEQSFGRQGIEVSLEHDFGAGVIDFRPLYRNAGA